MTSPDRAPLLLASSSPRRRMVLSGLGAAFAVVNPTVEEVLHADAEHTVRENAERKAAWAATRYPHHARIAADTVVCRDGQVLGKPSDLAAAVDMLLSLGGRTHEVLTAMAFAVPGAATRQHVCRSAVTVRPLTRADVMEYFRDVSPLDKAGAYDIASRGDFLVTAHTGSMSNIMGLDADTTITWLREHALC